MVTGALQVAERRLEERVIEAREFQVKPEGNGDTRRITFIGLTTRPVEGMSDRDGPSRFDPATFREVVARENARIQAWREKRAGKPIKVLDWHTAPAMQPVGMRSNRGKVGLVPEALEVVELGPDPATREMVLGLRVTATTFEPHFNRLLDNGLIPSWSAGWFTLAHRQAKMPDGRPLKVITDWELDHFGGLDEPADPLSVTLGVEVRTKKEHDPMADEGKDGKGAQTATAGGPAAPETREAPPAAAPAAGAPDAAQLQAQLQTARAEAMAFRQRAENAERTLEVRGGDQTAADLVKKVETMQLELRTSKVNGLIETWKRTGKVNPAKEVEVREFALGLNEEGLQRYAEIVDASPGNGVGVEVTGGAPPLVPAPGGQQVQLEQLAHMVPPATMKRFLERREKGLPDKRLALAHGGVVIRGGA